MQALKEKINKLKQSFEQKQKTEVKTKRTLKRILEKALDPTGRYLKNFYCQNKKLFLEAQNKSAASELLFKKEEILNTSRAELGIEEVIIN
ncbi:MAG: hypothetical protein AAB566_02450 [Patescibacteria group bacterium]